jgi:hypothetical protein
MNCIRAFDDFGNAIRSLRATLAATAYPLLMPVHFRTAVSVAKLGIIDGKVNDEDLDECWRAAEFFSTSHAFDRYWYAEALLVQHLAETKSWSYIAAAFAASARQQQPYRTPIQDAAKKELTALRRSDKLTLLDPPLGRLDARPLLLD